MNTHAVYASDADTEERVGKERPEREIPAQRVFQSLFHPMHRETHENAEWMITIDKKDRMSPNPIARKPLNLQHDPTRISSHLVS